jgi:hypothetical protein
MLNTDSVAISLRPAVFGQQRVEVTKIVVAEHLDRATRGARAVDHAGVVERVAEKGRFGACQPRQRRQHRGIGLEAAGKQQRRLASLEGGKALLDGQGDLARAGHQARGGRAGAVAQRPFGGALP